MEIRAIALAATMSVACAPVPKPKPLAERCAPPRLLSEAERNALRPEHLVATKDSTPWRRTCDDMPHLPLRRGETTEMASFTICVHPEGFVYDLTMEASSGRDDADRVLWQALRRWRYQPIVRDGTGIPFCHGQKITYSKD